MDRLTIDEIRNLISYDHLTGDFFWTSNARPRVKCKKAGYMRPDGYVRIVINGERFMAHRLAWLIFHGAMPVLSIDHINGNPSDNRISNLRDISHKENIQNRTKVNKNSRAGLMGVYSVPSSKNWYSRIFSNGKTVYLGAFKTKELAHQAYVSAKRVLHGAACTI